MSLFDNIKDNIKKSLGVAVDKSREAIDLYNLQSSIWLMSKQKEHLFNKLGKILYEHYQQNRPVPEAALELCQDLENTDREIRVARENMKKLMSKSRDELRQIIAGKQLKCECGSPIDESQKFCGNCGRNIEFQLEELEEEEEKFQEEPAGFCNNCNAPYSEGDLFCPGCGQKLFTDISINSNVLKNFELPEKNTDRKKE